MIARPEHFQNSCTIYTRIRHPDNANHFMYARVFLPNIYLEHNSTMERRITGSVNLVAIEAIVPRFNINGEEYPKQLSVPEFRALSVGEYWEDMMEGRIYAVETGDSVIFEGENTRRFDTWQTSGGLMANEISNYVVARRGIAKRVDIADYVWQGRRRNHHIQIV